MASGSLSDPTNATLELEKCKKELSAAREQVRVLRQNSRVEFMALSEERGLARKKMGERERKLREGEEALKKEREAWEGEAAKMCAEMEATREKLKSLKEELENKEIRIRNLEEAERLSVRLQRELETEKERVKVLISTRDTQHEEILNLRKQLSCLDVELHSSKDQKEREFQILNTELTKLREKYQILNKQKESFEYIESPRGSWPRAILIFVEKYEKEAERRVEERYTVHLEGLEELLLSEQTQVEQLEIENKNIRSASEGIRRQMESRISELNSEFTAREAKLAQKISNIKEEGRKIVEKLNIEISDLKLVIREKSDLVCKLEEICKEYALKLDDIATNKIEPHKQETKDTATETDKDLSQSDSEKLRKWVEDIQKRGWRDGMDLNYLRNVLINSLQNGTLSRSNPIAPVLPRLLLFTPEEMEEINKEKESTGSKPADKATMKKWIW